MWVRSCRKRGTADGGGPQVAEAATESHPSTRTFPAAHLRDAVGEFFPSAGSNGPTLRLSVEAMIYCTLASGWCFAFFCVASAMCLFVWSLRTQIFGQYDWKLMDERRLLINKNKSPSCSVGLVDEISPRWCQIIIFLPSVIIFWLLIELEWLFGAMRAHNTYILIFVDIFLFTFKLLETIKQLINLFEIANVRK